MDYKELTKRINGRDVVSVSGYKDGECTVELAERAGGYYDPNALSVQTTDGEMLGYVGKKDPLRLKMLKKANKEEVTLPVLITNYHEEGKEKLWKSAEPGDMVQLWLRAFSKTPLEDNSFEEIESFTGEKVLWSEHLHICTDLDGKELMGGSTYASQFEADFDSERIAKAYAKKNGLDKDEVLEYWESLGKVSMDYGTSVHKAMEHYNKHYKTFGHDGAMPRQPHLRVAVEAYLKVSDFENCTAEPLITDIEKGMSGWIDTLRFVDGEVYVEDYKTNTFNTEADYRKKWPKKMKTYQRQMNYYGTILQNHGYKVAGIVIWHWQNGAWQRHSFKFKPIKEYVR